MQVCMHAQSCLTLCDPMDCSPPGSSVHRISQARILEWVIISCSRGSSWPKDWTQVSRVSCTGRCVAGWDHIKSLAHEWRIWLLAWDSLDLRAPFFCHYYQWCSNLWFLHLSGLEWKLGGAEPQADPEWTNSMNENESFCFETTETCCFYTITCIFLQPCSRYPDPEEFSSKGLGKKLSLIFILTGCLADSKCSLNDYWGLPWWSSG